MHRGTAEEPRLAIEVGQASRDEMVNCPDGLRTCLVPFETP